MEADITVLISLLAAPLAAGAAYGGIEKVVNRLDDKVDSHGERLAAVETETENLKARVTDKK